MNAADRSRLTQALRDLVTRMAAGLRDRMRAPGPARERALALHAEEQVGEDFEVWTDVLSRRAAVLWVLRSVYVRVLEDRGLLAPGRILDREAQELFERLSPNLGDTAFLRWVYRDLARPRGGLPELFAPQPAEVAAPADELSRALLDLWRHRDPDTGERWSFAHERFQGELMGDLYQELDPVVKDRFALCQTPDFVRAFILDRTLTPAIEAFGADQVRLLDPACGSGHFLIDGLERLVRATAAQHPGWDRRQVVAHCLDRVVGIDLNDYACALARARLLMTAAELAGVTSLDEAAGFHPHVYWADGLEQVEKGQDTRGQQLDLLDPRRDEAPRASLTPPEVRAALGAVLAPRFHAVVANPPYITEKDAARKKYHREKVGRGRRYVSAYRQYSLGSPFTERCFQLAVQDGFVGLITGNNFMKREFGKPLIEEVLANLDLTLVVDTSQAYIPFHGTPTVLLFARNRLPQGDSVRAVMGKRGETGTPEDPAHGQVWTSIVEGWDTVDFENEFVSVAEVARETFAKHPWSLGGGGAAELKEFLESKADRQLQELVEMPIGRAARTGEDEVYICPPHVARRLAFPESWWMGLVTGEVVRDWGIGDVDSIIYPYDRARDLQVHEQSNSESKAPLRYLWPYRSKLADRATFQGKMEDAGRKWFEYMQYTTSANRTPLSIAFAFVATHNHFVLDRGGKVFNRSAPVIKLPADATEDDHLALLGLLNSSTLAFWMRQVFHIKGGESTGKKRQSEEWSRRLEYDATKLQMAPIVDHQRKRITAIAKRLDELAREMAAYHPGSILSSEWHASELHERLRTAEERCRTVRNEMVSLQEELDWTVYVSFGLAPAPKGQLAPLDDIEPIASEHRPFAIRLARQTARGEATSYWFEAMDVTPCQDIPTQYRPATQERIRTRLESIEHDHALSLLEAPEHKRKWEPITYQDDLKQAAFAWLSDRLEDSLKERDRPATLAHLVAAVQDDARFLTIAGIYQGRRDINLTGLVKQILDTETVPNHPYHVYTDSGLTKRAVWEQIWELQRREDAGEKIEHIPEPPDYSQGSRGKSTDFLRKEYWQIRGKLDVPKERFIAFTEVPGRGGDATLYGWAGWPPLQRIRALLAMDEELEDAGVPLADRVGVLDSAWRLLPDAAREDATAASRLKAELQALVGAGGPSPEMLEAWRASFPPPGSRGIRKSRRKK